MTTFDVDEWAKAESADWQKIPEDESREEDSEETEETDDL